MKIKRLLFKLTIKATISLALVGYYGHLLYEKMHNNIGITDSLEQDVVSISQPFLNLLGKAEGVSNHFYLDNKGYATGYGFNPTQNTPQYNRAILEFAGVKEETIDTIINNVYHQNEALPENLKNIAFTQAQIDKMALYAKNTYEVDFLTVLKSKVKNENNASQKIIFQNYENLPSNQKAVLIHMTYKVGKNNLFKYNDFFKLLIDYLKTPNTENQEAVASHFVYHYTLHNKVFSDTRVAKIHHDMFMQTTFVPIKKESALTLSQANDEVLKDYSINTIWSGIKSRYQRQKSVESQINDIIKQENDNNDETDNQPEEDE